MLIRDTARRLTRYCWVERRLFEIVGGWSTDGGVPEVARLFAVQSHHHAWHAQLWAERLPMLHDVTPADLTVPPSVDDALADLEALAGAAERLTALATVVLPGLLQQYEQHLEGADAVADGPVIRALHLVTADEDEDRRAAESLLGLVRPDDHGVGGRPTGQVWPVCSA